MQTRYWSGSSWVVAAVVIDGNLIVNGSVNATKINSNGLTIRDTGGNPILVAGASLAASTLNIPGNYTNVPSGWQNINITLTESAGTITLGNAGSGTVNNVVTGNNKISSSNISTYISSAAIGSAYISSLNADVITTGSLNADRINAGSITSSKIAADAVTVDKLTAGKISIPISGQPTVQLGKDVGPSSGFHGLSLSNSDFNNVFMRRASDGVAFFRINDPDSTGGNGINFNSTGYFRIKTTNFSINNDGSGTFVKAINSPSYAEYEANISAFYTNEFTIYTPSSNPGGGDVTGG